MTTVRDHEIEQLKHAFFAPGPAPAAAPTSWVPARCMSAQFALRSSGSGKTKFENGTANGKRRSDDKAVARPPVGFSLGVFTPSLPRRVYGTDGCPCSSQGRC